MKERAKRLVKAAARLVFSDYRINFIYTSPPHATPPTLEPGTKITVVTPALVEQLKSSATGKVRSSASFAAAGLAGLALVEDGQPLSVTHIAEVQHYDRSGTWPLAPDEVALMNIATEDAARGRGLAVALIRAAAADYAARGRQRMIAFIWWTNTPSLRAFAKAGWRRIGFSIELRTSGRWISIRVPLG